MEGYEWSGHKDTKIISYPLRLLRYAVNTIHFPLQSSKLNVTEGEFFTLSSR